MSCIYYLFAEGGEPSISRSKGCQLTERGGENTKKNYLYSLLSYCLINNPLTVLEDICFSLCFSLVKYHLCISSVNFVKYCTVPFSLQGLFRFPFGSGFDKSNYNQIGNEQVIFIPSLYFRDLWLSGRDFVKSSSFISGKLRHMSCIIMQFLRG